MIGLFVLFISLGTISLNAQSVISGLVNDESGEALIGVNIIIQGTSTGTVTDFDGAYSLEAAADAVLEFSYTGYKTESVSVNGQSNINVTLNTDIEVFDEVVVIGYGSVKKSDVTGSVSSVKSEDLQAFPVLNAGQALQGRAAGVVVQTQNGGEPGADISLSLIHI